MIEYKYWINYCIKKINNKTRVMMNGTSKILEEEKKISTMKKPGPLRTWNDNADETDLEVPGTPRTPRTSTTPGRTPPPW